MVTGSNEPGQRAVATRAAPVGRRADGLGDDDTSVSPNVPRSHDVSPYPPSGSRRERSRRRLRPLDHDGRARREPARRGERRRAPRRPRRRARRTAGRGTRGRTAPRRRRAARNARDRRSAATRAAAPKPVRVEVGADRAPRRARSRSTSTARAAPRDSASIAERAAAGVEVEHLRVVDRAAGASSAENSASRTLSVVGRTSSPAARRAAAHRRLPRSRAAPGDHAADRAGRASALEEELDGVAEEVLDLFAQLLVALEVGVGVEDLLGDRRGPRSRSASSCGIRPSLRSVMPGLALAEHLARAADLEVALGEDEPVGRLGHRLHARLALGRRRLGEEEAARPVLRRGRCGRAAGGAASRPKRSASSTTITVAFGTSTPTSMTVVATSTSSLAARGTRASPLPSPRPASARAAARGAGPRAPRACSRSNSSVAALASSLSEPSTSGQTTYAWRPGRDLVAHAARTPRPARAVRRRRPSSSIGVRPAGSSRSSDLSRSP